MAQNDPVLLDEIVRASQAVAEAGARSAKIEALASCLRRARPDEVPVAVTFLSGTLARIGVGWASLRDLPPPAAPPPTLELLEVDAALRQVGALAGPGSQSARKRELTRLFARATEPEQRFLVSLLHGELRQGALEGVMVEAVARAAAVPAADVRRALMLAGELPVVAAAALADGREGLESFRLDAAPPRQADARADRRPDRRGARALRGRPPSSGSSTARGSRCTGSATRCAPTRATWRTSPTACRRSSRPSGGCR